MRNVIGSIIRVLCTTIMGIMVVAVRWQTATRYILDNPSTVTEEAFHYLLAWITIVGITYAYGKRKQLSIDILLKKASPSVQKIVDIGIQCLVIVLCIVIVVMGNLRLCATAADRSSVALGVPIPYVYSCLLVGAVLFIFYALVFTGEDVKKLRDNRGRFTAERPIAERKNSLHLADAPKDENRRSDIS